MLPNSKPVDFLKCLLICLFAFISSGLQAELLNSEASNLLDYSQIDFAKIGPVDLKGTTSYYWNKKVTAPDSSIQPDGTANFPGFWAIKNDGFLAENKHGLVTFYMRLRLPDADNQYAIKLRSVVSAYEVWANGELLCKTGNPAINEAEEERDFQPRVIDLPKAEWVDLYFVVSNHYHWRGGGTWEAVLLGTHDQITNERTLGLSIELIACAVILFISLYHFILFIFYPKERGYLYFGLFTFVGLFFLGVRGEMVIDTLFPDFPYSLNQRLRYISFYMNVGLAMVFISFIFSRTNKIMVWSIMGIASAFSFLTFVLPLRFITYLSPPFQIIALAAGIYMLWVAFRSYKSQPFEFWVFGVAGMVLFLTMSQGILITLDVVSGDYHIMYGYYIFILAQTFLLAYRHKMIQNERLELHNTLKSKESDLVTVISDNRMRHQLRLDVLSTLEQITKTDEKDLKVRLNRLITDLKLQVEVEDKLNYFQQNIDEINTEFEARLKARYPDLTPSEVETCLLTHLNLSIKEIARIRRTSEGAIKTIRHRIKKKMELSPMESLDAVIPEILAS